MTFSDFYFSPITIGSYCNGQKVKKEQDQVKFKADVLFSVSCLERFPPNSSPVLQDWHECLDLGGCLRDSKDQHVVDAAVYVLRC